MGSEIGSVRNGSSGGFSRISKFVKKADNLAGHLTLPIKLKAYQFVAVSLLAPHIVAALVIANLAVVAFNKMAESYSTKKQLLSQDQTIRASSRTPSEWEPESSVETLAIDGREETPVVEDHYVEDPVAVDPDPVVHADINETGLQNLEIPIAESSNERRPGVIEDIKTRIAKAIHRARTSSKKNRSEYELRHMIKTLVMDTMKEPVIKADNNEFGCESLQSAIDESLKRERDNRGTDGKINVAAFIEDADRGVRFIRNDRLLRIADKPIQGKDMRDSETRVRDAKQDLIELVSYYDNENWIPVLQAFCTQQPVLSVFHQFIAAFNEKTVTDIWEDDQGVLTFLDIDLSEELPPIKLTVERNLDDGKIEKVHFNIKGSVDAKLNAYNKVVRVVEKSIITGKLSFTVSLNEKSHHPEITEYRKKIYVSSRK